MRAFQFLVTFSKLFFHIILQIAWQSKPEVSTDLLISKEKITWIATWAIVWAILLNFSRSPILLPLGCWTVWTFFLGFVLLTVMIPVGASGQFAVYDSVLTEVFLPGTGPSSDHHPANIATAARIYAIDDEAAFPRGIFNGEEVTWLGCHVSPWIFSQSLKLKPVRIVWSLDVEFQLLNWIISLI